MNIRIGSSLMMRMVGIPIANKLTGLRTPGMFEKSTLNCFEEQTYIISDNVDSHLDESKDE